MTKRSDRFYDFSLDDNGNPLLNGVMIAGLVEYTLSHGVDTVPQLVMTLIVNTELPEALPSPPKPLAGTLGGKTHKRVKKPTQAKIQRGENNGEHATDSKAPSN